MATRRADRYRRADAGGKRRHRPRRPGRASRPSRALHDRRATRRQASVGLLPDRLGVHIHVVAADRSPVRNIGLCIRQRASRSAGDRRLADRGGARLPRPTRSASSASPGRVGAERHQRFGLFTGGMLVGLRSIRVGAPTSPTISPRRSPPAPPCRAAQCSTVGQRQPARQSRDDRRDADLEPRTGRAMKRAHTRAADG